VTDFRKLFAGWVEESDDWELVAPRRFSLVVFRWAGTDEERRKASRARERFR